MLPHVGRCRCGAAVLLGLHPRGRGELTEFMGARRKANDRSNGPEVLEEKLAAGDWVRFVRDFGTWRYICTTEQIIKNANGSWESLVVLAKSD